MSRGWLIPVVPLFAAAVAVKHFFYDHRWLRPDTLRWPVVSVGNLSVGGSGKTPLVIRLAQLLKAQGIYVDVLSRGYGRRSKATTLVDPFGSPARYGDEPIVIARAAEVPVIVGITRYRAGRHAQAPFGPHIRGLHLLDDGFQHRQLARNVDIVLVRADDLKQRLLPAGNLREPLAALNRAQFLVIREEEGELEAKLRQLGFQQPVWKSTRRLAVPVQGERCFAFCGIARPSEFFRDLRAAGKFIIGEDTFRDHHRYSNADMRALVHQATTLGADCFLTTEKDAVKLDRTMRASLEETAPVHVVPLLTSLHDEPAVIGQLLATLD